MFLSGHEMTIHTHSALHLLCWMQELSYSHVAVYDQIGGTVWDGVHFAFYVGCNIQSWERKVISLIQAGFCCVNVILLELYFEKVTNDWEGFSFWNQQSQQNHRDHELGLVYFSKKKFHMMKQMKSYWLQLRITILPDPRSSLFSLFHAKESLIKNERRCC